MNATESKKWTATCGPRQAKAINDAAGKLRWLADTYVALEGVIGGEERRSTLTECMIGGGGAKKNPAALERYRKVCERFQWTATRQNAAEIVRALEAEIVEAKATLPVVDKREAPAVVAERNRHWEEIQAKDKAQREVTGASHAAILAKRPPGAAALIVAEFEEDRSDIQSDYFNSVSTRHVAIGWRTGSKEDFRQLRRAAATFPETVHLGPGCDEWRAAVVFAETVQTPNDGYHHKGQGSPWHSELRGESIHWPTFSTEAEARAFAEKAGEPEPIGPARFEWQYSCESVEHRENWSMGAGNYLKRGSRYGTGWKVRSVTLGDDGGLSWYSDALEDGFPVASAPAAGSSSPAVQGGAYSILESTNKRGPFFLVVLAERVERAAFETLRDSAKRAGGWYSRAWGKAPGGFGFDTQEAAAKWAGETFPPAVQS